MFATFRPLEDGPDNRALSFRSLFRGITVLKKHQPRPTVSVHTDSVIVASTDPRFVLVMEWTGTDREFHTCRIL